MVQPTDSGFESRQKALMDAVKEIATGVFEHDFRLAASGALKIDAVQVEALANPEIYRRMLSIAAGARNSHANEFEGLPPGWADFAERYFSLPPVSEWANHMDNQPATAKRQAEAAKDPKWLFARAVFWNTPQSKKETFSDQEKAVVEAGMMREAASSWADPATVRRLIAAGVGLDCPASLRREMLEAWVDAGLGSRRRAGDARPDFAAASMRALETAGWVDPEALCGALRGALLKSLELAASAPAGGGAMSQGLLSRPGCVAFALASQLAQRNVDGAQWAFWRELATPVIDLATLGAPFSAEPSPWGRVAMLMDAKIEALELAQITREAQATAGQNGAFHEAASGQLAATAATAKTRAAKRV